MQSDEPKALTIFKNKPFLLHILDTIKKLDPTIKPIIVIGHKKERIKEVLGENYIYAEQHEQLGTGHAVLSAKKAIDTPHEIVLVVSADQPLISKETIERIIQKHLEKNPTITLTTVTVPDFEDWRAGLYYFGRIIRRKNGQIEKMVELRNANEDVKKHFISGPSISESTNDFKVILKLIEDSIERKSRKVIEDTDKKQIN